MAEKRQNLFTIFNIKKKKPCTVENNVLVKTLSLSQVDNATDNAVKPNIITKEPEVTEILQDNESQNENEKVRNLKKMWHD